MDILFSNVPCASVVRVNMNTPVGLQKAGGLVVVLFNSRAFCAVFSRLSPMLCGN